MRKLVDKLWVAAIAAIVLFVPNTGRAEDPPEFLLKWGMPGSGDGEFDLVWDVAVDASGNVYVADTFNHRIQKFTSTGTFLTKWGTPGSGDGEFDGPTGIALDASGNVYVADEGNERIQKFTSNGAFLTAWGPIGIAGFQYNIGIAVDSDSNVYVADDYNRHIAKFTSNGVFLTTWGSGGTGDGQFDRVRDVAVDASGNVYVVDRDNYRIQKFTSDGTFLTKWGSIGDGTGQFNYPAAVAVDASGNVYVTEENAASQPIHHRIQKFTSTGAFLTTWGSYGGGDGYFSFPRGVAVDASDNVYVADTFNNRIQKFAPVRVITASAGPNGSIDPSGLVGVANGGSQTFTITPDAGYDIADVLVDEGSVGAVSSYTFTNVTANHTIAASYAVSQVGVDEVPETELSITSANPIVGSIMFVHVALPSDEPAMLELLDVSGRRVVSTGVGGRGAGRHAINLAEGKRPSSGLYFLRLTQGTQTRTARVVVIQ